MWSPANNISGDMDLTAAPFTSAPTQGTAPTGVGATDGWHGLRAAGGLVPDELYLLVYLDDDDAVIIPWFYVPDLNVAASVGKHIHGAVVTALVTPTADAGAIFRIPVPPMATHVRLQSTTSSTNAVAALYSAEEAL